MKKEEKRKTIILGAGITGLSAGYVSGLEIFEANNIPGGICTSYYMRKNSKKRLYECPKDEEVYHFEIGGGHWIFGGDPTVVQFINKHAPCNRYTRRASVYLPEKRVHIPYPIQNNLSFLDKRIALKAMDEIINGKSIRYKILTMAKWLEINFGKTLCKIFFHPFHHLYTAGLYKKIAPQDAHKSPINRVDILKGLFGKNRPVGYNTTFIYPQNGLDFLIKKLAKKCIINYNKKIKKIDIVNKTILFSDKSIVYYSEIISTLPLNEVMRLAGINKKDDKSHPSPAVLVINIGAKRGKKCPNDHWIYVPNSKSGFHRVGFYNNVDSVFIPRSNREMNDRVCVYVERAYPQGIKPNQKTIEQICKKTIHELQEWNWIEEVEVYDPTWINTAYTWSWPNSSWREYSLDELGKHNIYQIGRYGRWIFQGIAESIKDGLMIGAAFS